jgi:hypothetical protein
MSETKWGVWCAEWNSFVTAQAFDTATGAYVHQKKLEAVTEGLQYDVREMPVIDLHGWVGGNSGYICMHADLRRGPLGGLECDCGLRVSALSIKAMGVTGAYDNRANELADRCGVLESELAECQRVIGALTSENERLRRRSGTR